MKDSLVTTCPLHSGIEAEIKSVCTKIDLRFDEVNRRLLNLEKIILRVNILEQAINFRAGARHWSDYIITSAIAFGVFLIAHYVVKF